MSALTMEQPAPGAVGRLRVRSQAVPSRTTPPPVSPVPVRPARQSGRGQGPRLRPAGAVPAPSLRNGTRPVPQACRVAPPAVQSSRARSAWRLTDRGIAVVLVAGAMIMTAAFAVVTLTALRVTGDGYAVGTGLHATR